MKPLKIAVCLSGQSRTWKAAVKGTLQHFSSDHHQYFFFGHTWDENCWKTLFGTNRDYLFEKLDAAALEKDIRESIPMSGLKVDPQAGWIVNGQWCTWAPMLKSTMLANNMKTQYEITNNMMFDLVVKTRWDALYDPRMKFESFIPLHTHPNALYCMASADFAYEYRLPAVDDIMYFGSSTTMNVIDSLYHYYTTCQLNNFVGVKYPSRALDKTGGIGVGVLLYKWATRKNILLSTGRFRTPGVIRKNVEHMNWPEEYEKMKHAYIHFEAV